VTQAAEWGGKQTTQFKHQLCQPAAAPWSRICEEVRKPWAAIPAPPRTSWVLGRLPHLASVFSSVKWGDDDNNNALTCRLVVNNRIYVNVRICEEFLEQMSINISGFNVKFP
jgi:hypothetical protein